MTVGIEETIGLMFLGMQQYIIFRNEREKMSHINV